METVTVKLPDIFVEELVNTLIKGKLLGIKDGERLKERIMKNPEAWMMSLLIESRKDASDRKWSTTTHTTLLHTGSEDSLTEAEKILREQKLPE